MIRQQDVDRDACAIDDSAQALPLAADSDERLPRSLDQSHWAHAPEQHRGQQRQELACSAMNGDVINANAALGHDILHVAHAQREVCVSARAEQHHLHGALQGIDQFAWHLDHHCRPVVRHRSACQRRLTASVPRPALLITRLPVDGLLTPADFTLRPCDARVYLCQGGAS